MRFRLGIVTGFAAGYVLGTKAGQERYEQIRQQFDKLMGTEPAQQLQNEVRIAAERAGSVIEEKATEGVAKAAEMVNGESNGNGDAGASTSPTPGTIPPA